MVLEAAVSVLLEASHYVDNVVLPSLSLELGRL